MYLCENVMDKIEQNIMNIIMDASWKQDAGMN